MQTVAEVPGSRRPRGRPRIALLVFFAIVFWLIAGLVRGPSLAAHAFTAFEAPRSVSAITTTTFPLVVSVEGTVTESTGASYVASQVFLIEPISGGWLNLSQLGVAPSGS